MLKKYLSHQSYVPFTLTFFIYISYNINKSHILIKAFVSLKGKHSENIITSVNLRQKG